jgi:hypothetical protein
VAIVCPHCGHSMSIKKARPGRHTPRCARCGRQFVLTVPADPNDTCAVIPLAIPAEPAAPPCADGEQTQSPYPEAIPLAPAPRPPDVPETLGGYQILKELGRGGMGTVYLARQLSLDRKVALKVMKPQWAGNPTFMARFTREAYAAAQLVHHNVVQIHDIGSDRGFHYFSMEYVEGPSLGDLVKRQGPLPGEVAAGYVLQAARGLKFGHDRGLVHRDVKPDNLLLNDQGIVKVADLGLVKTPAAAEPSAPPAAALPAGAGSDLTLVHTAVGTPAYMAPEQARDSTHVDGRADIYALGCTLYVLVTGRPPFQGSTALEVITRHAFEPMVPANSIVKEVPKALSDIILKMTAKKRDERYANMGEVIRALEGFLGVQAAGVFTPREEHAALLDQCVRRFNEVPAVGLRLRLLLAFFAGCVLLALLCVLLRRWWLPAAGLVNLALLTPLAYLVVRGAARRTYLFRRAREFVPGIRLADSLTGVAGVAVFLGVLYLLGLLGAWLLCCLLAVALGVGFYLLVDRQVVQQQRGSLDEVEQLLRHLRQRGLDEDALREFVCRYGGEYWEAFYEALFGYEAKRAARARWGQSATGRPRAKYAGWRDLVADWLDARLRARHEARERQVLRASEQKGLEAQGVAAKEAEARAEQTADAVVGRAPAWPEGQPLPPVSDLLGLPVRPEVAPPPAGAARRRALARFRERTLDLLLGPRVRFLVGLVLLAGCAGWMYQNDLIPGEQLKKVAGEAVDRLDLPDVTPLQDFPWTKETKPLSLPLVPAVLTDVFASFNPGAAGLILVLSALLRGGRITLFGWAGAILAFVGQWFAVPALEPATVHWVSMAAGAVLAVPGFLPGRLA